MAQLKYSKLKCDLCGKRIERNPDGTLRATVSRFTNKRYCWKCPR
jgi:hypothetical protein